MTMPAQKRGKSNQDVGTPREFLDAVERRFGPLAWDLAASEVNHVVEDWYGTGSPWCADSLSPECQWRTVGGLLWLNPPFANIDPWAWKCSIETYYGARPLLRAPASLGAKWYWRHVHGQALVLALQPRLTFVGSEDPYPKDLILAAFGEQAGIEPWRWKESA